MYENLTNFLNEIDNSKYGEWIFDNENDGTAEHPLQMPFVNYSEMVHDFIKEVYNFIDIHPEYELTQYKKILDDKSKELGVKSLRNADISLLDGRTVMALLVEVVRVERFSEGALLNNFENGNIKEWLLRLQKIDLLRENV